MTEHWQESKAAADALVAFSELKRGDCPVVTNTFTINYVMEGVERYEFAGRVSRVEAGNFLLVEPGSAGRAILQGENVTRGLSIYLPSPEGVALDPFDPALVRQFQFRAAHSGLGRMLIAAHRQLAVEHRLDPHACSRLVASAEAEFKLLVSRIAHGMTLVEARKPSTRRDLLRRVYQARDYLMSHLHRTVSLAEVARCVGMSQFHLARVFAAVLGAPPLSFHAAARLAAADDALRSGNLSVAEAAALFGFSDRSSFSRAFRRERGVYPARVAGRAPS